uniref:Uncharacterized protein n=1 Tax=Trichuris muris TaxID=70415 RepID=A0A5S6QL46_TRIMR
MAAVEIAPVKMAAVKMAAVKMAPSSRPRQDEPVQAKATIKLLDKISKSAFHLMASSILLVSLAAISLQFQLTLQISLAWKDGEREKFKNEAEIVIRGQMERHQNPPFGLAVFTVNLAPCLCDKGRCPPRCHGSEGITISECVMCYVRRGYLPQGNLTANDLCDKWTYPRSDYPQLQIPDYLKSPHTEPLVYYPPRMEDPNEAWTLYHTSPPDRWPKNVHERTGFAGLGGLLEFGANPVLYLMLVSKQDGIYKILSQESTEKIALPQFFPYNEPVNREFILKSLLEVCEDMGECSEEYVATLVDNRIKAHKGYLKDPFNTDNAWYEGLITRMIITDSRYFGLTNAIGSVKYHWIPLGSDDRIVELRLSAIVSPFIANYA